jgi:DNA mismatch repair protein MSH5
MCGGQGDGLEVNPDEVNNDPSLLLLTGANFSGKSIYLKQVALIVYMAHVGW